MTNYTFTKTQVVVTCWQYFVCVKLYLHQNSGGCNVLGVFCLCQIIPSTKLRWLQGAGSILSVSNYTFTKTQVVVTCWQYFVCVKLYLHKSSGGCNVLAVFCLCQIYLHKNSGGCNVLAVFCLCQIYLHKNSGGCNVLAVFCLCQIYLHKNSGGCNMLAVFCLCQIIPSQKLRWL